MDLFGNIGDGKFRALGWWQPFGSLMLSPHLKKETRVPSIDKKTGKERKLPMPLGKYLLYTTLQQTPKHLLFNWCGEEIYNDIIERMKNEPTANLLGYAIGIGYLTEIRDMRADEERECFIKWKADKDVLIYQEVKRIEPFEWKFGKQGVGFVPDSELHKIKIIQ